LSSLLSGMGLLKTLRAQRTLVPHKGTEWSRHARALRDSSLSHSQIADNTKDE
jgi:hypothetical protein